MVNIFEGKIRIQTKRLPRLCSAGAQLEKINLTKSGIYSLTGLFAKKENNSPRHNLAQAPSEMPKSARKSFHNNHSPSSAFTGDHGLAHGVPLIKSISLTGQAALELAILGSLILVVFASVLSYGQRFDSQVDLKMEAFRKALNRAYARNAGVSYTLKKDKRFYNLLGNFGEGQPTSLSASATVMWQKGLAGCQHGKDGCANKKDEGTSQGAFAYYEINNQLIGTPDGDVVGGDLMIPRYPKQTKSYTQEDPDEYTIVKVPASVYFDVAKRKTNLTTRSTKEEKAAGVGPSTIDNKQELTLNENIYTTAFVRYDKTTANANDPMHIPEYVYAPGPTGTPFPAPVPSYGFEGVNYTIFNPGTSRQGSYYNTLNNRIEYDPTVGEGDTTTKTRNWHTIF